MTDTGTRSGSDRDEGEASREILRGDSGYPERLERLPDPPARLFVIGTIPDLPVAAIVGSRKADARARRLASDLAGELARSGVLVVSGGAAGVDTAAHRGALDGGGPTVAVIGSGFDHMYPPQNRDLFREIARNGALVTELDHETPPTRWTFPRRNRLVAAMASAVIVVRAGERSGALVTARIAREIGVPVGAVPGDAGDPICRGSNGLLRGGAGWVEGASDALALMGSDGFASQLGLPGIPTRVKESAPRIPEGLSEIEVRILEEVGRSPLHIDELIAAAGVSAPELNAAITSLEIAGLVEDRGGKNFVRVG